MEPFCLRERFFLRFLQAFTMLFEMLGISELFTITGRNQAGYSQIYSDSILANGQGLNGWIIESNRDMPTSRGVKAESLLHCLVHTPWEFV